MGGSRVRGKRGMFKRHVEPPSHCRTWWPAHAGITIVVATIVAVVIVVVALQPNRVESKRRVVVSFLDKTEAAAAQTGPTLPRTEIVRGYTWGGLVLRLDPGVSNGEVVNFYKRSVLVEDDPLVRAVPASAASPSTSPEGSRGGAAARFAASPSTPRHASRQVLGDRSHGL